MRTNSITTAGIATALLLAGGIATATAPVARADTLTCFVNVSTVERGESEVHFGFQAHCTIVADTIHTETRLWRTDTPDPKETPKQRGAMRPEDFLLQQDVSKSYAEPCQAGAAVGYWHAAVAFTATKGFTKDSDTVINTEPLPAIAC